MPLLFRLESVHPLSFDLLHSPGFFGGVASSNFEELHHLILWRKSCTTHGAIPVEIILPPGICRSLKLSLDSPQPQFAPGQVGIVVCQRSKLKNAFVQILISCLSLLGYDGRVIIGHGKLILLIVLEPPHAFVGFLAVIASPLGNLHGRERTAFTGWVLWFPGVRWIPGDCLTEVSKIICREQRVPKG